MKLKKASNRIEERPEYLPLRQQIDKTLRLKFKENIWYVVDPILYDFQTVCFEDTIDLWKDIEHLCQKPTAHIEQHSVYDTYHQPTSQQTQKP